MNNKDKCTQQKAETEKQQHQQKQAFPKNIPQRWTNIVTTLITAAENTLGIKSNQKQHVSKKSNEMN